MPRQKWIDKSKATTYQLVHRSQDDPLIHDAEASSMVFKELGPAQAHKNKVKSRAELESELFAKGDGNAEAGRSIRDNEGEAAEYGIFYDDSEYDYMQHIRDLGDGRGGSEAHFVESSLPTTTEKTKTKLEDALREMDLDSFGSEHDVLVHEALVGHGSGSERPKAPSKMPKKVRYQDQQDIPDELAGFQPDMDPRLREVLEALDDDAYVDDEEDFFGEITADRAELSKADFDASGADSESPFADDDDWASDTTEKPSNGLHGQTASAADIEKAISASGPDHGDGAWMAEFSKFKSASSKTMKDKPATSLADRSALTTLSTTSGRRRRRKGARTSTSGYSMTSSSLARTEGQTLLDARFDRIEEKYNEDLDTYDEDDDEDGGASVLTGLASNISDTSGLSRVSASSRLSTASSQAPNLTSRKDFDSVMDEFLGTHSMQGKRRVKKGRDTGIEQLDEIRQELGRPNVGIRS